MSVQVKNPVFDVLRIPVMRPSKGFWGTGTMTFISGEQGNKCLKMKRTAEQKQFWGTGNIGNQDFDFGEQEQSGLFQGNKGTGSLASLAGRASVVWK